ncbi:chromobox protein homolog 1 [Drosophila biarmipes]|uniref:chromobox protein homolog 1 n=1 Tax=Drosophila biarmipes TaxID=125945 RepID=UPI0021CC69A7|nr:chromobox protein homolog 1 [Drosophila biarmipes]
MDSGTDSDEDSSVSQEYIVEKILARRHYRGAVQYLVKWLYYSDEDNTWEMVSDLSCLDLIKSFESQRSLKRGQDLNTLYEKKAKRLKIDPYLVLDNPFNHGFTAEEIIKAFKSDGYISILIKFADLDQPQLVPSEIAYQEIPQMVLQFYEKLCNFDEF